jgi:site-specific DNA-methyltransferase (adenine-specific)
VSVSDVRELQAVADRERAEIGVLITLREPTQPMRSESASRGFYRSPWGQHPRLQIRTVAELLQGRGIDYPRAANVTFRVAPRAQAEAPETLALPLATEGAPIKMSG